jgi:anthraniloyl-CoA monooxygenase
MKAAAWYAAAGLHCPPQYLAGKEQIFRNSARERDEITALRRKSKPRAHADTWNRRRNDGKAAARCRGQEVK